MIRITNTENAKEKKEEPVPTPIEAAAKEVAEENDAMIQEVVGYDAGLVAEQTGQLRIF